MKYTLPFDPPTLPNFTEYVSSDGFLPHEVDQILALWDREKEEKAAVSGDEPYRDDLRKSSVVFLEPSEETHWLYERIANLGTNLNIQRYGFELQGFLQPLQLIQYEKGEFFDWHLDFGPGEASHRKLSVTVQLSDEDAYEGGDLEFKINNRTESAPRRKGTVIIFPSFILHRVTEVTAGKRNSIVGWISGPPYR